MFYLTPIPSLNGLFDTLLLIIGFLGLGRLLSLTLKFKVPLSIEFGLGVSFWVFVGIIASQFHLWQSHYILCFRIVSLLLGAWALKNEALEKTFQSPYILAPLLAWIAKTYLFIHNTPMNVHDDYHAYLPMLFQLKQTGAIQDFGFIFRAPFQFGGQLFLESPLARAESFSNVLWLEPLGFGLMAILMLESLGKRFHWPPAAILFSQMILAFSPLEVANITAGQSSVVLSLTLVYLMSCIDGTHLKTNILLSVACGILLGALASLKLYFLVWGFFLVAVTFVARFDARPFSFQIPIRHLLLCGTVLFFVTSIYLFPFIITSIKNFRTPLFPLLGARTHISQQNSALNLNGYDFVKPSFAKLCADLIKRAPHQIVILFLPIVFFVQKKKECWKLSGFESVLCLALAYLFWLAVLIPKTGIAGIRYSHDLSVLCAALICGVLAKFHSEMTLKNPISGWLWPTATLLLLPWFYQQTYYSLSDYFDNFQSRRSEQASIQEALKHQMNSITDAQLKTSPGERILAFIDTPFLLNFQRNPIYVTDNGGTNGFPTAVGITKDHEEFRRQLTDRGIKYILYSFKDSANFPKTLFKDYLKFSVPDIRTYARFIFHFQERVRGLSRKPFLVYKNKNFLLVKIN